MHLFQIPLIAYFNLYILKALVIFFLYILKMLSWKHCEAGLFKGKTLFLPK